MAAAPANRKAPPLASSAVGSYHVLIERDEEGWLVASVPELPGCRTQARSQDELLERIKEAILLHIDVHGDPGPTSRFVGVQRVTLAA